MAARRKGLLLSGWVFSALVSCFLRGVISVVPDGVVYTDLHKNVQIGDSVILTCQFRGPPLAVYWKKGYDPRRAPNLVSWIPTDNVTGLCEGERPCQIMEMNKDHSLVIKEVSIAERGQYICRVSSYKGKLIHNFTDISVFSTPAEPYPVIKQCANDSTQECSISTNHSIKITCSATSFYPALDLFFLHGFKTKKNFGSIELANRDGTKSKSISIKVTASNTPYICVASDIPGLKDQRAATIFVNSPMISTTAVALKITTSNTSKIDLRSIFRHPLFTVVPIILVIVTAVVFFAFFLSKHPHHFRRITTNEVTGSNVATTSDPEEIIVIVENATIAGSNVATTSDPEEIITMEERATMAGSNVATTYDPMERILMLERATIAGTTSTSATTSHHEERIPMLKKATSAAPRMTSEVPLKQGHMSDRRGEPRQRLIAKPE